MLSRAKLTKMVTRGRSKSSTVFQHQRKATMNNTQPRFHGHRESKSWKSPFSITSLSADAPVQGTSENILKNLMYPYRYGIKEESVGLGSTFTLLPQQDEKKRDKKLSYRRAAHTCAADALFLCGSCIGIGTCRSCNAQNRRIVKVVIFLTFKRSDSRICWPKTWIQQNTNVL